MTRAATRRAVAEDDDFLGEVHVYERHRASLPRLGPYLRELWRRQEFARELARSNLRAQHFSTFFGMAWLVINPLLLGFVYFLLVSIIRGGSRGPEFLAHLLGALFIFYFASDAINQGAKTVVGGGRLIMNTAFPRLLLTVASTRTAFARFLPTVPVYAVVHVLAGLPVTWALLWVPLIWATVAVFAFGVASFFATLQVYFRDTTSFLPYLTRMWLYVSPILWTLDDIDSISGVIQSLLVVNPLYPVLGAWGQIVNDGQAPSAAFMLGGAAWALGALLIGGLFFMSREREFAVRL